MRRFLPDFRGREKKKRDGEEVNSAIQPFKLVKYFAFTSFAVILVAPFVLSWVASDNAKRVLLGVGAFAVLAVVLGFLRFKRFVDEDPRLCAACHRSSPEFALWLGGTHKSVACQRCHHSTPRQGVSMLGAFVAGKKPEGRHAQVEVGACASCHLSHDPRWPQA